VLPKRIPSSDRVLRALTLLANAPLAVALALVSLAILAGLLGYLLVSWWTGITLLRFGGSSWTMP